MKREREDEPKIYFVSFEDIQEIFDAYMVEYKSEYIPCAKYSYTYECIEEFNLNKTQML